MRPLLQRLLPATLAAAAQCLQAVGSLLLILVASRFLDVQDLGLFSILYGLFVLGSGLVSGFVGDSSTVLDRSDRRIRGGLEAWFLIMAGSAAMLIALAGPFLGFTSPLHCLVIGLAGLAFMGEEIVRRQLMIGLSFGRVTLVDLSMILGTVAALGVAGRDGVQLIDFVVAILVGQTVAALNGVLLLPRSERYLVRLNGAKLRAVAGFGVWRAAQQGLRPALLTSLRFVVVLYVGLAAAGELEIARVYAAPALLLVGGFASFLLPSYARDSTKPLHVLVGRADRAVLALAVTTVIGSVLALLLLPMAGPLLTGREPDPTAVAGWLCLSFGIGVSIPYGSLAAVRGKARTVFAVRLGETLLSLGLAVGITTLSGSFVFAPLCAAVGALSGALVLRLVILAEPGPTIVSLPPSAASQRRQFEPHV